MERTHKWAERSLRAKSRQDQALFGILQGGVDFALRRRSAEYISGLDTPGIAIGGLSVGETKPQMYAVLDALEPILPADRPRYLMGVGTPEDLLEGIARGVDIFDCVLPTRLARHNSAFSRTGRLNLMNASFARDERPVDSDCDCYTCLHFSRAYLRHLISAGELLAGTLLSTHNLRALIRLVEEVRASILQGTFEGNLPGWLSLWGGNAARTPVSRRGPMQRAEIPQEAS
jgi:queuine tRNA-ribosyltransferase